jgi:putative transposase
MWLLAREICRWLLVCCEHATAAGCWVASGGVPLCPGGAAADPCPAAPFAWTAGVGRGCVVRCLGAQRLAAGPPGDSAGWVPGTMPGAGRLRTRDVRGAGHDRCPVGPAPVFGRLVRRRETPPGRDVTARFPRRRRRMVPVRWYHGTFGLDGRRLRVPITKGCPQLAVRLDRDLPYPGGQVRSATLVYDAGRLWVDITAVVPVTCYPDADWPERPRVAGVDVGIIHPYAVAGPGGQALLVSGRALRAECRQHLRDAKARHRAVAHRAPKPGQRGSRRWRKHRRRQRMAEACHRRRIRQAQHEAARKVVAWAQQRKVGTLAVGDPRGVLALVAGRRHNQRTRAWRIGHLLRVLHDKAETAGIIVRLVDERGTSSTCPACGKRIPKPAGRVMSCPSCGLTGHRDLLAAANIAARTGRGTTPAALPAAVMRRRAGAHLPGVSPARRDPRRRAPSLQRPRVPWPAPARPAQLSPGQAGSRSPHGEERVTQPQLRAGALNSRRSGSRCTAPEFPAVRHEAPGQTT